MKDALTPNLTSLATSVRPLAAILKTIFQILCSISPERLDINVPNLNSRLYSASVTSAPNFVVLAHSVRLYNAKTFSGT